MSSTAKAGDEGADELAANKVDYKTIQAGDDAKQWLSDLKAAGMREDKWRQKGHDILARYRQERATEIHSNKPTDKKYNILWAITDTMMAHLCVDLGTPDVRRQFPQPGRKTQIARQSAEMLEKVMTIEDHAADDVSSFEKAIEDHQLPGRGQVWIDLEEGEDENGDPNWLEAKIAYVDWEYYREGPARSWKQMPWVGRGELYDGDDLRRLWPDYADQIPLNYTMQKGSEQAKESLVDTGRDTLGRALVWEIWCKQTRQRIYVAEDFAKVLEASDDPYHLKDFFPCPEPLYATKTTNNRTPSAFFLQYQDQAEELDRLSTRSYRLMEALKYCGIYGHPGGETGEDTMQDLSRLEDGEFMPYKGFAVLAQGGGLEKAYLTRDLQPIAMALQAVEQKIETTKQRIYDITGVSDIIRGQTDPNETYGAQQLKARFGSKRSSRRQRIVQRFVRDAYRLKAEVVAEHYSREQLQEMTGIPLPTKEDQDKARAALDQLKAMMQQAQQQAAQAPQMGMQPPPPPQVDPESMETLKQTMSAIPWEEISAVLRSNARRMFMVDVETDDTAFVDEEKEKEGALEFMKVFMEIMQAILPAVQQNPLLLPVAKESVLFTVGSFKVGQAFEDVINDAFDKLAGQIGGQPQQAKPDPKDKALEARAQADQAKAANERMRLQNSQEERKQNDQRFQIELEQQAEQTQQDRERHQQEMMARMERLEADREEMRLQMEKLMLEITGKRQAVQQPPQAMLQ